MTITTPPSPSYAHGLPMPAVPELSPETAALIRSNDGIRRELQLMNDHLETANVLRLLKQTCDGEYIDKVKFIEGLGDLRQMTAPADSSLSYQPTHIANE